MSRQGLLVSSTALDSGMQNPLSSHAANGEVYFSTTRSRLSSTSIFLYFLLIAWYACGVANAIENEPLFMGSLEFDNTDTDCQKSVGDKLTLYVLHSERETINGVHSSLRYLSLGSVRKLLLSISSSLGCFI